MEIIFWGTRGSISTPWKDQLVFGAHTTCIEIRDGADSLLFDAGFGIGRYSDALSQKAGSYHLFFTHFHWDHVQGIGYFFPIFLSKTDLHIYSPWKVERLQRQLNYYFDYSFGPFLSIDDPNLKSKRYFHSLNQEIVPVNGFEISYFPNKHKGDCYGYAICRRDKKIALITDHEAEKSDSYTLWGTGYDVVIHDAQYTDDEYQRMRGRGHSTFIQAIENSRNMGTENVLITHHEPLRADNELLAIEDSLQKQYPRFKIQLAREQERYAV